MGIEDIPEMQLRDWDEETRSLPSVDLTKQFDGQFVVLQAKNGKDYVFALRFIGQPENLDNAFRRIAIDEYGYDPRIDNFSMKGYGYLQISEGLLKFYDKGGHYSPKVVSPIAEKWKQQNLPNHELVFE